MDACRKGKTSSLPYSLRMSLIVVGIGVLVILGIIAGIVIAFSGTRD